MAVTDIYLHGHGGWKPNNGYTDVPKNCSVTFYTHFAKLLNATMAYPILTGTFTGESDRTIEEYKQAPNMVLTSLTAAQYATANQAFAIGPGRNLYMLPAAPPDVRTTLGALMTSMRAAAPADVTLRFHWLACQQLGLKPVGGGKVGVNASDRTFQNGHRGQYLLRWTEGGVQRTAHVQSTSSIHNVHDPL